MKLTRAKLTETLRRLADGKTVYQARKVAKISVRRVYQVKEAFDKTGEIPDIGKYNGRPRKPFEEWEILLVKKAFERYRVSADTLERLIDRDCKKHIGHNRIHQILVYLGYAKKKDKTYKEKQQKALNTNYKLLYHNLRLYMIELTKKEQEALLTIYKDVANFYNANSLSKELGITQVGTMKLLKRFEKNNILVSKKIGKSIVYKINIEEEFVQKLIAFALINEASKYQRWKDEFKSLNKKDRILLFYGSASRDYSHAKDIDIFVVINKEDFKEVSKEIEKIQSILPKKVHTIKATKEDLIKNIKENNKSMTEILKTAIVLYGYDKYMEVVNGFTSF